MNKFSVIIDITRDDINHGRISDCHECPAARALARQVPNATYIAVAGSYARMDVDSKSYKCSRNETLRNFVLDFDNNLHPNPQKIQLDFVESF